MLPVIVVATKNVHKLEEFRALLSPYGLDARGLPGDVPDCEENGDSFEANALEKAVHYSQYVSGWVIADDSGLAVEALGGEPGVRSARYAGAHGNDAANRQRVLDKLSDLDEPVSKRALFVCALASWNAELLKGHVVRGELEGEIVRGERGEHGFGYDPLFLVPNRGRTLAELAPEDKNEISHRAVAVRRLFERMDWMGNFEQ